MSNFYNNNNFNGFNGGGFNPYAQRGTGFQANGTNQTLPAMTQFLNEAQMELLKKKPSTIAPRLTEMEYYIAICTHKDKHGNPKVEDIGGGQVRCAICGQIFTPLGLETPIEQIKKAVQEINNVWNSIKLYWGNAPMQIKDVYMAAAFNDKAPEFWNLAVKYFSSVQDQIGRSNEIYNGYGDNTFNTLSHIIGGSNVFGGGYNPYNMPNMYNQPMYNYNNPMMGGAVMPNPNMGTPNGYFNNNGNFPNNNVPNYNNTGFNQNPNGFVNNQTPQQPQMNPNTSYAMPNNPIGYHERPMTEMSNPNASYGINTNSLVQNNNEKVTAMGEVPIPGFESNPTTNQIQNQQPVQQNPATVTNNATAVNPNLKQPNNIKIEKKFQG